MNTELEKKVKILPEDFREWNEKMVVRYDPDAFHHHSNPLIRYVEKKRVKIISNFLKNKGENVILEVGCGAGNVIGNCSHGTLFGVDLSSSILKKAKSRVNSRIHLFQGDAQDLPCRDQIFDIVICSEVLEHLLDPSLALSEISRILLPDGEVILSVPNEEWINRIKKILIRLGLFSWFVNRGQYKKMPERMDEEWHIHSFSLKKWIQLFEKEFKIARIKGVPFPWIPLRYVILLKK